VVTHDVPDHALVVGVPARQVGWVCRCGVRRVRDRTFGGRRGAASNPLLCGAPTIDSSASFGCNCRRRLDAAGDLACSP
jgi:UDP-2-acetamido-3-amino-2,3-dideoxy-glucuronate N-acetyltransferase